MSIYQQECQYGASQKVTKVIGFGAIGFQIATATIGGNLGKFVGAFLFPTGLALVLLAGSELFTGNCLLVIPLLEKEASLAGVLKCLPECRAQASSQAAAPSSFFRFPICGRTEKDGDNLEFRFCSKCNGNYEYCQEHLFTHTHVK